MPMYVRPDVVYRSAMIRPLNQSADLVAEAYNNAADFTQDQRTVAGQFLIGRTATQPTVEYVAQQAQPQQVNVRPGILARLFGRR